MWSDFYKINSPVRVQYCGSGTYAGAIKIVGVWIGLLEEIGCEACNIQ